MTSETFPFSAAASTKRNNSIAELVELAVCRKEGRLARTGAFVAETGEHTGRSARDKYTLKDSQTEDTIWWDNNQPMSQDHFDTLYSDFLSYAADKELFVQDLFAGADSDYRLNTRVFCEKAWHALFIRH
ncbi:MAG: phosphoenolpyruvate carboxykinase (ATP), partial [Pseudomonadota bacterium]